MKIDMQLFDLLLNAMSNGASREKLLDILRDNKNTGDSVKTLERIIHSLRYDYQLDIVYEQGFYKLNTDNSSQQIVSRSLLLKFHSLSKNLEDFPESIDFGPLTNMESIKYLEDLISAIKNRNIISVYYQSYSLKDSKKYLLVPKSLKYWNYRWYLIALKLPDKEFRTFGIDRILRVSNRQSFQKSEYPDVPKHIIGVSNYNLPSEEIEIQIDPYGGQMFQSLSYHPSQRVTKLENGNYKVTWQVAVNKELIELLCSLHQEFNIIKPESLKYQLEEHLERVRRNLRA